MMDSGNVSTTDVSPDNAFSDTSLFEFSSGSLPAKPRHVCRIFYNNINGLEIKDAIHKAVQLRNIKNIVRSPGRLNNTLK